MNAHQDLAFRSLLTAWNRREEARTRDDFAALASARIALEDARAQMYHVAVAR